MELTSKCKEDFEKWLKENYNQVLYGTYDSKTYLYDLISQGNIKNIESIINALIIDWFDSLGNFKHNNCTYSFKTLYLSLFKQMKNNKSISEIQKQAIKKANEIYNQL